MRASSQSLRNLQANATDPERVFEFGGVDAGNNVKTAMCTTPEAVEPAHKENCMTDSETQSCTYFLLV